METKRNLMFWIALLGFVATYSQTSAGTQLFFDDFLGTSLDKTSWSVFVDRNGQYHEPYVSNGLLYSQGYHTRIDTATAFDLPEPGKSIIASAGIQLSGEIQKFGFAPNPQERSGPITGYYFDTVGFDHNPAGHRDYVHAIVAVNPGNGTYNPIMNMEIPVSWDEFHQFEIERTSTEVIYYIDGLEVVRISDVFTGALPVGIWNDRWGMMLTDWVEVYQVEPTVTIESILNYMDNALEAGTLFGSGSGKSADGRLGALFNMIITAGNLIDAELYSHAYEQLNSAYIHCDGLDSPADFVQGASTVELSELIKELLNTTGEKYVIYLEDLTSSPLVVGQPVTISGTLYQYNKPVSNKTFNVNNGISQTCEVLSTDENGRFSFISNPVVPCAAIVEYFLGSQVISTGYDIVNANDSGSLLARAIAVENTTDFSYSAIVTSPYGDQLLYDIHPGETVELVRTSKSMFNFHPTSNGGVSFPIGLPVVGGTISATRNTEGIETLQITGGTMVFLRFTVYGTSELNYGACWSPGGEIGAGSGVEGGFDICVGSDGFSVGGGGTLGNIAGGFTIQIIQW